MSEFKPNIYPIIYWALAFGAAAAVLMFLLVVVSQVITGLLPLVFLAAAGWGAYRNYRKQKNDFEARTGVSSGVGSPIEEFKQAVNDIAGASQDLVRAEQEARAEDEAVFEEEGDLGVEEDRKEDSPQPPNPPTT